MNAFIALVRREYIEHRLAFLVVPGIIIAAALALITYGFFVNDISLGPGETIPANFYIFDTVFMAAFGLWTAYLLVVLTFYVADAFNADRRNNALLFWKSMPQSDLKVLSTKMAAAGTLFPALVAFWALVTGIAAYFVALAFSSRLGLALAPDPGAVVSSWVQISAAGIIYMALTLLWFAPFFAWVGLLGTVVGRWAIPLSLLVPALVALAETAATLGGTRGTMTVSKFLEWRFTGLLDEQVIIDQFTALQPASAGPLIATMLDNLDVPNLLIGLAIGALMVWLASEYRRRITIA
jgi:ABC-2 type transport system permease protein